MSVRDLIIKRIQAKGPMPFAEYMDLCLYHPQHGYYSRVKKRTGQSGDFFTSVDIGSLFGELLCKQFTEMQQLLNQGKKRKTPYFTIVEAGAGSGRLCKDVLDHAKQYSPDFYHNCNYVLIEKSQTARSAQKNNLMAHESHWENSQTKFPVGVNGVIFANELLDAFPVHLIEMNEDGLREIYVNIKNSQFVEQLGPISSRAQKHVEDFDIALEVGWRAEVCPEAISWVNNAAKCLNQGFLILIDYGFESHDLYSDRHRSGTLRCYQRHTVQSKNNNGPWLRDPGESDITAHVDLTAIRQTAERAGLSTIAITDQTYFLLSLASNSDELTNPPMEDTTALRRRLALKTLLLPGSLGSTHKVLIFGKGIKEPQLQSCTFANRIT
tara:strand:- start:33385 stop:34530 length:1146 start_codon:yes stop_codon:yes gene_type:complete